MRWPPGAGWMHWSTTRHQQGRGGLHDPLYRRRAQGFVARLPKQRLIEPQEIAKLIAFLLTPHSRVLHGAVLDASMGLGGRPGLMTEMGHLAGARGELPAVKCMDYFPHPTLNPTAGLNTARCAGAISANYGSTTAVAALRLLDFRSGGGRIRPSSS